MDGWTCQSCSGANAEGTRFCGHCGTPAGGAPPASPRSERDEVEETLRSFVATPIADRLAESHGHLAEERRLITALFADVSGFTRLATTLDSEALLEVVDPVIRALTDVVGRYEGYVEKFAGDALLALFGAPRAHDDDAVRGVLVALEMKRELERLNRELPGAESLSLHIGVNTGHGIARVIGSEARLDYAVLGEAVIFAQRLESQTPTGEIYVGEMTYRLARERIEFEYVGELELKGKSEPVPAWRVVGERASLRLAAGALIGRKAELETVVAALGAGGVVALVGEAGVGKSRLAEGAREQVEVGGKRWLQTRCISYGAALAYWPYAELLRAEDAGRESPLFARLLGESVPELDSLEPEAFRRALHAAFAEWLAGFGDVVLAVEDLHWMDASSAALTAELARGGATLFLTGRPESETFLADLDVPLTRVSLGPLDTESVARLIEHLLGAPPPRDLAAHVVDRTGGNALFVQELIRSLHEQDKVDAWREAEVPPTVEGVLAARIDTLPADRVGTLQTASVIGRRVPIDLLRAVAGDVRDEALDDLVARTFLDRDDGAVVFHHALVQEVAYARLLRRHKRDLHRRVAEAAEELYGASDDSIDLLARHLYLGEAGDKAREYLLRAGRRAKRMFANAEAIEHLSRAAELASEGEKPELLLEVADLDELVGEYDEALRLYSEVRDATGDGRAWRGIAATLRAKGDFAHALAVVDEALRARDLRATDVARVRLEAGRSLVAAGRFEEAIEVFRTAIGQCAAGDETCALLLLGLARAMLSVGDFERAVADAERAKSVLHETGDLRALATALRILGGAYNAVGRLDDARGALLEGLEIAERVGSAEEIAASLVNLGRVEMQRGAVEEAIAADGRAIAESERVGSRTGAALAHANLADKLARAGRYDEAREVATRALALSRALGNEMAVADVTDTIAIIERGTGNAAAAAQAAEQASLLYERVGAVPRAAEARQFAAEAWAEAGDDDRARALGATAGA